MLYLKKCFQIIFSFGVSVWKLITKCDFFSLKNKAYGNWLNHFTTPIDLMTENVELQRVYENYILAVIIVNKLNWKIW